MREMKNWEDFYYKFADIVEVIVITCAVIWFIALTFGVVGWLVYLAF